MSKYTNIYVGENKVSRRFKGCFKEPKPSSSSSSSSSSLETVNQCLESSLQKGLSLFGLNNKNKDGLGYCNQSLAEDKLSLIPGVDESDCINKGIAVYNIQAPSGGLDTIGNTYLSVDSDPSNKDVKAVFHKFPESMLEMGKAYYEHENYDSPDNNLTNANIANASSEQCKQFCINRGQECKGFVYDKANNSCSLKGEVYPTSKREINKSKDIYTRMPDVKHSQSCPGGIKAVTTDFLNSNGFISSENMSMDFQCETEGGLMQEERGLESAYKTLTEEVNGLQSENTQLLNSFRKVNKSIKEKTDKYHQTGAHIDSLAANPTVDQLMEDSGRLETVFSMRNTALMFSLILLSIILVRVLRK
jgi:hypothetical protein